MTTDHAGENPATHSGVFEKHVQGSSYSRASNFVECSCGWYLATDYSAHGEYARARFNEHVIDAMQDALVALTRPSDNAPSQEAVSDG